MLLISVSNLTEGAAMNLPGSMKSFPLNHDFNSFILLKTSGRTLTL